MLLWMLCCFLGSVVGGYSSLRIENLLPNLLVAQKLAIEPALPEDFVALARSDWIYWGKKEILEEYFLDPKMLQEPILRVQITPNMRQDIPGKLNAQYIEPMRVRCGEDLEIMYGQWGPYPYCRIAGMHKGKKMRMAYVGMNAKNGAVLLLHLISPKQEDLLANELWESFFSNTKSLEGDLFLKIHGWQMEKGYTTGDLGSCRIEMRAEKRIRDGKVRLAFIPAGAQLSFALKKISWEKVSQQWILIAEGTYRLQSLNQSNYHRIPICIQEVEEFSSLPMWKQHMFYHYVGSSWNSFSKGSF